MNDLNAKKEELVKQFEGLESTFSEIKMLMTYYECAILEVKTKLDVLNKEFQANELRNPIETIKTRIKSPASIMEKLERKGFELSIQSIYLKRIILKIQRKMDIEVFTLLLKYLFFFQMRRNQCVWKFRLEQLQWTFGQVLSMKYIIKSFQIQMWKP